MPTNTYREQTLALLIKNKKRIVAALQAKGYAVTERMKLSDVEKYLRWETGVLDVMHVKAVNPAEPTEDAPQLVYFTKEQWEALTLEERAPYLECGIRVRAYGQNFIFAKQPLNAGTATTYASALNLAQGNVASDIAPYKAFTADGDTINVTDSLTYSLPTVAQAMAIARCATLITSMSVSLSPTAYAWVKAYGSSAQMGIRLGNGMALQQTGNCYGYAVSTLPTKSL